MAYGFQVLNSSNDVLFSDTTPAVVFWGKVTVTGTANYLTSFVTNAPNFPVVFVHGSQPGGIAGITGSAGNWTVTLTTGATTAYVFCRIPNLPQNVGWGLNTYNNNSLTFSTNYRSLKIVARTILKSGSNIQTIDYGSIPTTYAVSCPYIGFQLMAFGCYAQAFKLAIRRYSVNSVETFIGYAKDDFQYPNIFSDQPPAMLVSQLILFINPAEYV